MPLSILPFGPFSGVIDSANPTLNLTGKLRAMQGFDLIGAGKLVTRSGTATVLTFKDDQGSPADVTSVCGVWQFRDKAVAIAHSTGQTDCYLYVLNSSLTDWYNNAGTLQGTTSPQPAVVIWTGITTSPDVFVAEGLGTLYIAHAQGVDSTGLNFASKSWDGAFAATLTTLTADLDGAASAEDLYFNGVVAFQNHLFSWGFGSGTTAATAYDPSKARFSAINFGAFSASDSITIGNRVKSDRERIINGGLAGNALILQGTYITTRVTGYGRSSWFREVVDESSGITGPKAGVSHRGYWWYWSHLGPQRIASSGPPEPLYDAIKALVASVVNPEKIVAAREPGSDCIVWYVDTGSGVRTRVAYHVPTSQFLSADDDIGIVIRGAGEVAPIIASTSAGVAPPAGPPTTASTTSVGTSTATANWVTGDVTAQTQVEYRIQGAGSWTVATLLPAGTLTYAFTGLSSLTDYEWRAAHYKGGQYSSYLGPVAGSQFTTLSGGSGGLLAPTNLALAQIAINRIGCTWTNSGEAGVETEVYLASDSGGSPGGYSLKTTVATGVASATITTPGSPSGGTFWVRIRHVLAPGTSAYTSDVSIVLS